VAAELVITSVLTNDGTVSGLVSDRVNPSIAEDKEDLPFVVYELQAGDRWQAHDGYTGVGVFTYVMRCFAATRVGATALADAVRIALDHLAETTVSGQTVLNATSLGSDETFEYRDEGAQTPVYETSVDFDFYVREAVS